MTYFHWAKSTPLARAEHMLEHGEAATVTQFTVSSTSKACVMCRRKFKDVGVETVKLNGKRAHLDCLHAAIRKNGHKPKRQRQTITGLVESMPVDPTPVGEPVIVEFLTFVKQAIYTLNGLNERLTRIENAVDELHRLWK